MHEALVHEPEQDLDPDSIIYTPDGIPGFDSARRWALELGDDEHVFGLLHNLDQQGIGLMVTEPWDLAPGYEPDIPDEELARIGINEPGEIIVLVIATVPAEAAPSTVWLNLAAPITVNSRTRQARQVILDRQGWPLRHPVATRG